MKLAEANKIIKKHNLIPKGFYNPLDDQRFLETPINVMCSVRSVGKTTNFLIIGLCLYWLDQTQTVYVRQMDEMTRPKNCRQLFNIIIENGYIEKITGGKYNSVTNYSRYWYLCKIEDGEVVEKDPNAFMITVGLNEIDALASSLNTPHGDWIIYDEFISRQGKYFKDEFFMFMDLMKTVLRDRLDAHICMLSNTVDKESKYFYEMEIRDLLEFIDNNVTEVFTTRLGTKISFRVMTADVNLAPIKKASFLRFFGFLNPRMSAITGIGELFSFAQYPHLEFEEIEYLARNIFCEYMRSKYLQIEFIYVKDTDRVMLHIHKSNPPKRDDAVVLVADTPRTANEITWFSKIGKKILRMRQEGLVTYGTNSDGSLMDKIVNAPKLETR